jgi:hypothetical protein
LFHIARCRLILIDVPWTNDKEFLVLTMEASSMPPISISADDNLEHRFVLWIFGGGPSNWL